MPGRMPLPYLHPVTNSEARPDGIGAGVRDRRCEHRAAQREPPTGAGFKLGLCHQPMLDSQGGRRSKPVLVIAGGQVVARIHSLDRVPELATAGLDRARHQLQQRPGRRLPLMLKNRFRRQMIHRPETLHATQVMDAVHQQIVLAQAVTALGCWLFGSGPTLRG